MLFNSVEFAIFLPIVFALYWIVPAKYQWGVILIASCIFYMSWNPKYIVLIAVTVITSYICAVLIEKYDNLKKIFLIISIVICMGFLFVFKYFGLLIETLQHILNDPQVPLITIILPVGISFYTFQTMSYVIDVYKHRIHAEHNLGIYATFVIFFPQLVAGPIERAENLLPQIRQRHDFDYEGIKYGLQLMVWGYFKKLVIADNLATHVDLIYSNVSDYTGLALIVATVFFAFQIYCDFSGYSDIARGVAELFGIKLMVNFNSPYLSTSLKEFWGRWHISLSTWFRDYVYIPLGGNRKGNLRRNVNLIITFLVSGLWHGANWTFAIWGLLHGILQAVENVVYKPKHRDKKKRFRFVSMLLTFCIVCICWVFFRASSTKDAIYVIKHSLDGILNPYLYIYRGYHDLQLSKIKVMKYCFVLVLLFIYDYSSLQEDVIVRVNHYSRKARWGIYYTVLLLILIMGNFGSNQFVYFQF